MATNKGVNIIILSCNFNLLLTICSGELLLKNIIYTILQRPFEREKTNNKNILHCWHLGQKVPNGFWLDLINQITMGDRTDPKPCYYTTCTVRFGTLLARYASFLERYGTLLARYVSFLARNGSFFYATICWTVCKLVGGTC